MDTERMTTVTVDRGVAADLKTVKLVMERQERRTVTLSEAVALLLRSFAERAGA